MFASLAQTRRGEMLFAEEMAKPDAEVCFVKAGKLASPSDDKLASPHACAEHQRSLRGDLCVGAKWLGRRF